MTSSTIKSPLLKIRIDCHSLSTYPANIMIQPLVFFLVLLLLASPSLSQGSAGKMDNRPPRNNNTWLIHGMVFTHRVSPARPGPNTPPDVDKYPPLWGQFILVRSKIKRDQQGSFWNHLPAMLGVYCQHSFQLADLKNNVWGNCESYAEAAIGEEELSEDTKSRLKWRMLDYKTTKNKDSPFGSITFQIVNTLKPARYCDLDSCKAAYSHAFKIPTIPRPQCIYAHHGNLVRKPHHDIRHDHLPNPTKQLRR